MSWVSWLEIRISSTYLRHLGLLKGSGTPYRGRVWGTSTSQPNCQLQSTCLKVPWTSFRLGYGTWILKGGGLAIIADGWQAKLHCDTFRPGRHLDAGKPLPPLKETFFSVARAVLVPSYL